MEYIVWGCLNRHLDVREPPGGGYSSGVVGGGDQRNGSTTIVSQFLTNTARPGCAYRHIRNKTAQPGTQVPCEKLRTAVQGR